jgi:hypothetical protein
VPALVYLGGSRLALLGVAAVLPLAAAIGGRGLLGLDTKAAVPVVEIALLRSLPLFAELPAPAIEGLAAALTPLEVPAGTALIRQGDQGDAYYAIAAGELDVMADQRFLRRCGREEWNRPAAASARRRTAHCRNRVRTPQGAFLTAVLATPPSGMRPASPTRGSPLAPYPAAARATLELVDPPHAAYRRRRDRSRVASTSAASRVSDAAAAAAWLAEAGATVIRAGAYPWESVKRALTARPGCSRSVHGPPSEGSPA